MGPEGTPWDRGLADKKGTPSSSGAEARAAAAVGSGCSKPQTISSGGFVEDVSRIVTYKRRTLSIGPIDPGGLGCAAGSAPADRAGSLAGVSSLRGTSPGAVSASPSKDDGRRSDIARTHPG